MGDFSNSNFILQGIIWVVSVLVSLAVGFGMISGTLPIWILPSIITSIAGWIVVILTLLGVLISIIHYKNN